MKIHHLMTPWTSIGVSMETPPFTMTLFQSAHGQVAVSLDPSLRMRSMVVWSHNFLLTRTSSLHEIKIFYPTACTIIRSIFFPEEIFISCFICRESYTVSTIIFITLKVKSCCHFGLRRF